MIPMSIKDLRAIDVHAHFGQAAGHGALMDELQSGDAEKVVKRAQMANTRLTIVSPLKALMPRRNNDSFVANKEAIEVIGKHPSLRLWAVLDPLKPETYSQVEEMLALDFCVGIKIHPEEHGYKITEHGRKIFEFAAKHKLILMTHSGEENSLPADFVRLADDFAEVTLILAHLGCSWDDDLTHQVRAIQACKNNNVFTDTSSAMGVTPGLFEWGVSQIGAERLLYGTDSPVYFAPMQRARIDNAEISDEEKKLILCKNAEKLFNF